MNDMKANTLITKSILREWSACKNGLHRFCELFPDGADLKTAADRLAEDGHSDWSLWLFEKCRGDERFKEQAKDGFRNAGNGNAGNWNTGDWNTGHFNTITPDEILAFNKPCKLSVWEQCEKPNLIYNLVLTWWVPENKMTDAEKAADPNFYMRGGQLRCRTYKEAWRKAWDEASVADRELVRKLPNFDATVFKEISGIDVGTELQQTGGKS